MLDMVPRYAPSKVRVTHGNLGAFLLPVRSYLVHPANAHPKNCPIKPDMVALELVTVAGSRFYGCEQAYINSELRMVVIGFDSRDGVRSQWEVCKTL